MNGKPGRDFNGFVFFNLLTLYFLQKYLWNQSLLEALYLFAFLLFLPLLFLFWAQVNPSLEGENNNYVLLLLFLPSLFVPAVAAAAAAAAAAAVVSAGEEGPATGGNVSISMPTLVNKD